MLIIEKQKIVHHENKFLIIIKIEIFILYNLQDIKSEEVYIDRCT